MDKHKRCFIPLNQPCSSNCMAYRHGTVGAECVLLELAEAIKVGVREASRPQKKTVHPKSAPPPKVHT